jgi:transposase InsO family protein
MTRLRLPRHQYSVRDVKSGAIFLDYANELSTTYASLGIQRILHHLKDWGVPPDGVRVSTDNGSEYGGQERRERDRGFPATVRETGATHRFIPPATPNAHADVESMHSQIQAELFDLETFSSREDFFNKVSTYQLSWNFARPNYSKGGKTPAHILAEEGLDPLILLLPPLDLDQAFRTLCREPPPATGAGQGVPALPAISNAIRRTRACGGLGTVETSDPIACRW